MADVNISIISHMDNVNDTVKTALMRGLWACGETAEGHAKEYETAVDTGRLRNSITHAEDDKNMIVGTNVEYAKWIEEGSRGREGLYFLKRAISEHGDEYQKLLQDSLNAVE